MNPIQTKPWTRRDALKACLCGIGAGAGGAMPALFSQLANAAVESGRILVVLELSGARDSSRARQ